MKKKLVQVGAQYHADVWAIIKPKRAKMSLAKRILEIAKSDMSDQLKEGEIATLFGVEVHNAVLNALKMSREAQNVNRKKQGNP